MDVPASAGGVLKASWVLRVCFEGDDAEPARLVEYGDRQGRSALFKRLGYLAERLGLGDQFVIEECRTRVSQGSSWLDPAGQQEGRIVSRWNLRVNIARLAPVAQRIRELPFGTRGRGFESLRACRTPKPVARPPAEQTEARRTPLARLLPPMWVEVSRLPPVPHRQRRSAQVGTREEDCLDRHRADLIGPVTPDVTAGAGHQPFIRPGLGSLVKAIERGLTEDVAG